MNLILQKTQNLIHSLYKIFDHKPPKQHPQSEMHFIPISEHQDYYLKIKPLLQEISQGQLKNAHIIQKLKQFQQLTFIHKEQLPTDFTQLKAFKQDITPIFTKIAQFLLSQQQKFKTKKLNLLLQSKNDEITLDKEQVLYLMSLMAMNLVPPQQYNQSKGSFFKRRLFPYPYDFADVFSDQEYKTKTVIEYFRHHFWNQDWKKHEQKFIIKRKYLAQQIGEIVHKHKHSRMIPYELKSDGESIQNFSGHVKVDFANKYIGGGALSSGCVQEEIMFANHPQLFTSVLFCEVMNDHEAIFLSGFKKYSKNVGYGWSTKYNGQEKVFEGFYKQKQYIVAIDALHFPSTKDMMQSKKEAIDRQIKKAYIGFSDLPEGAHVVTGNWGCGAFNGDVRLKFMIQWLACSMAKRKMIYCPFGHRNKISQNELILKQLEKKQIGQVYQALIKGGSNMKKMQDNIFKKMRESYQKIQVDSVNFLVFMMNQ